MSDKPDRRRWPIVSIVVGLIASAVSLVLLSYLALVPLRQVRAARDWNPTACTIVSSQMKEQPDGDDGVTAVAEIAFRYDVGNKQYLSHKISFFGLFNSHDDARVRANPAGARRTCFVDPADPSDAVLDRGLTNEGWRQILLPVPFLAIGVYFVVGGFWRLAARTA